MLGLLLSFEVQEVQRLLSKVSLTHRAIEGVRFVRIVSGVLQRIQIVFASLALSLIRRHYG